MSGADWLFLGIAAWITLSVPASILVGRHLARRAGGSEAAVHDLAGSGRL